MTNINEINKSLCEALGVDLSTRDVEEVVLTIKALELPTVEVRRHSGDISLPPIYEQFELKPKENNESGL